MKVIHKSEEDSLTRTVLCLKEGGVAVLPTDTVYGFSSVADFKGFKSFSTDSKIRLIKGRGEEKPFIHLIASPEDIFLYTDDTIPPSLLENWPGPLTIIVSLKKDSPLITKLETAAFRCPGDEWLRSVIKKTGRPVFSTSVNRSGCPVLDKSSSILEEFSKEIDLLVDDGDKKGSVPSTIVKIEEGTVKVLRQGELKIGGC